MNEDEFLWVAETHPACRVLGPGTRFVVWVQGCPMSCAGCISPQWIPFDGGHRIAVADLAAQIAISEVDGLTLSGGEPFSQAPALVGLISQIRARRDLSVMCYTGYTLRHLRTHGDGAVYALINQIDLLIDGGYIKSKHASLRWRASSNQKIHHLTKRHVRDIAGADTSAGLQIEVLPDGSLQWLGVPAVPGFRSALEGALDLVPTTVDRTVAIDE
jgi:anaerobic ribonucleoside-triphosphate reductase activating protein